MKLLKRFFRLLIAEDYKGAICRIICFAVVIAIFGFVSENTHMYNGKFLSDYMGEQFALHSQQKASAGYVIYYLLLYVFVVLYSVFAIITCLFKKEDEIGWCIVTVISSIVFLIFINAYLTIMLQYKNATMGDDGKDMYSIHATTYNLIASLIIGIAGIKMGFLLKTNKESVNQVENGDKENNNTTYDGDDLID